jgi:hypothetical protein
VTPFIPLLGSVFVKTSNVARNSEAINPLVYLAIIFGTIVELPMLPPNARIVLGLRIGLRPRRP